MEVTQNELLEELLLAPKGDNSWTTFPPASGVNQIFRSGWNSHHSFDLNHDYLPTPISSSSSSSLLGGDIIISPPQYSTSTFAFPFEEPFPIADIANLILPELGFSSYHDDKYDLPQIPFIQQEYFGGVVEDDDDLGLLGNGLLHADIIDSCKISNIEINEQTTAISADASMIGLCELDHKKSKVKKVEGQPSKNLMAERRRRKRLNDRLSMLRSIVPKISKMDRTSILGDTIDYMKDLLDKIHNLREENTEEYGMNHQMNMMGSFKELKPNEALVRNPPKFDVERRNLDTRIGVCCTARPGLLLSTVSTLEALGLDIQQCVISCFNDFSVQASCSEVAENRGFISSDDIKQALFRNAGYGGRSI